MGWRGKRTLVKVLAADCNNAQARVLRRADLLGLLVGGGHPEGEAAGVDEGGGGEGEYVVEHGEEAVGLLGGDVVGEALARLALPA